MQIAKEDISVESNGNAESASSSNSLNNQMISNLKSEPMYKCQEDLIRPLLSSLSKENVAGSSPAHRSSTPDSQNLISTASNTSPSCATSEPDKTSSPISILNSGNHSADTEAKVSQQTVTTTIPSHPSTIQYIPIIQTPITQSDSSGLNVRTVHLIQATVSNQSDTTQTDSGARTSTIRYQYVPATVQHGRGTIHYPPNNVQFIHSGSSLIMSSNSLITAALQSVTTAANESAAAAGSNKFLQIIPSNAQNPAVVRNIQVMSLASDDHENTETDQNIRVLTPSEIMKTLPSLGQESFDVNSNTVRSEFSELMFWFGIFLVGRL